ncbi:50S ribosomal protein L9 [Lawsonia intracellularis]|uniref:Large ribosomal subunit protein bL9 n=1 Tax=Lawsonia intracellularis (strain PHE/MN1-00) TaxID=363253 RepID=RL9_LAWIP|nr:50S ribosomal protein L9 [Lawsonia intracellularis]Q1MRG7.1 RecName: Full=Large ribosomal subunit protein bL9; AltName: Full=50S ribosomal protein L9 [Lawsonia intracellularis PHE/MN1-00]AGC49768.1 50S ribosomal protein L9 [Lawsonia intracellularis N343]KAA0205273.1 50S ribosomal protein L9 [Lawsonia intracellularis]MBZ3892196.1 50S ribosomal protein L9 [Lawsonia intracellularis]OMQ04536.1 50S ribosomal protein L9 [Lawsonia intracellularis]RBN32180.1 50S ribosomal protein L9 [Lawsonia intr
MKVILRSDVENLGRLGDIVTVKSGYGRNYLLPQGLAMLVTPGNMKVFELEFKKLQERMNDIRSKADELAKRISGLIVTVLMRAGDNDKLYGSVTTSIIGHALAEQGIDIDRRRILLDAPIRTLGQHTVRVRLHADVIAEFIVNVASEEKLYDDTPDRTETEESTKELQEEHAE